MDNTSPLLIQSIHSERKRTGRKRDPYQWTETGRKRRIAGRDGNGTEMKFHERKRFQVIPFPSRSSPCYKVERKVMGWIEFAILHESVFATLKPRFGPPQEVGNEEEYDKQ